MGESTSSKEINPALQEAMQRSLDEGMRRMDTTHYSDDPKENTVKLGGLIEIDKGLASMIEGVWTTFIGEGTRWLSPRSYDLIREHAPKLGSGMKGATLNRTAAGGAMAVNLGLIFAPTIGKVVSNVRDHHYARAQAARHLAPVLDEIMGKHSTRSFNNVGREDNSVIWAHRKRITNEYSSDNWRLIWSALAANTVNVLAQGLNFRSVLSGESINKEIIKQSADRATELTEQFTQKELAAQRRATQAQTTAEHAPAASLSAKQADAIESKVAEQLRREKSSELEGGRMVFMGLNFGLPQIINKIAESSQTRMKAMRQPYSAYEMIRHLAQQMENNPGHNDRFQLPGKHGREVTLTHYIADVFKVHQREMSDLDGNYTELRPSLQQDLEALAKPIASALREGKLDPLMLVRLAGENKVVKNHGRGLASPTELATTLEGYMGKAHSVNNRDPKDYLSNSAFSLAQLKDSLKATSGSERLDLAAFIPDQVLKAAGFSDKEVKEVQQHRLEESYKGLLMHAIMGMAEKETDELKAAGVSTAQIKQVHDAAQKLATRGPEALEALMSGPTNPDGVDSTALADLVVPKTAVGNVHYLQKLAEAGRASEKAQSAISHAKSGKSPVGKHAEKHRPPHSTHAEKIDDDREFDDAEHDLG